MFKKIFYKNVCLKLVSERLYFDFYYKSEVKTTFSYGYILALPLFECGCIVGLNMKDWKRQRQGALMSNHCLISHR